MPRSTDDDRSAASGAPRDELFAILHKSVREVFRDDTLWVLDKPAGIVSHPNPPAKRSANALLRAEYIAEDEVYEFRGGGGRGDVREPRRVFLIHRLDQDTGGLILCAFTASAAAKLQEDLYRRDLVKEYRALLLEAPRPPMGTWSDALARKSHGDRVDVRRLRDAEPNAETSYQLERTFPGTGLALVRMRPHTGRTHQLRVQAAERGVPIVGDERYGDFTANRFIGERIGLKQMFLHASRLELRHPTTGRRLTFTAEFGQRLTRPLEKLETLGTRIPKRVVGVGFQSGPRAAGKPGKKPSAQAGGRKTRKSSPRAAGGESERRGVTRDGHNRRGKRRQGRGGRSGGGGAAKGGPGRGGPRRGGGGSGRGGGR